jgi:hypothetical protein
MHFTALLDSHRLPAQERHKEVAHSLSYMEVLLQARRLLAHSRPRVAGLIHIAFKIR